MQYEDKLLNSIRAIHEEIRSAVISACESSPAGDMSRVLEDGEGDTTYSVDRISESMLIALFEREFASQFPILLIAEGLAGGKITLPRGAKESDALWRIIVDPIDGTRSLMYQKRSAWILTGVARNRGELTTLADIELAVQTELPLAKQHLCDTLWAVRGKGARGQRFNRILNERFSLVLQPSVATNLNHGFGSVTRFFSGGRDVLAAIDDEISLGALGPGRPGKAQSFEDQYLSTGGQLHELIMGHDRFQADLRPLLRSLLKDRGLETGLCCHPYDICTELIAREAGILISDEHGLPLRSELNLSAEVSWVGYANDHIRSRIEPLLQKAIKDRGLLESSASGTEQR
jgi:fructose-1,6-bisphosphatase/inositol monophosphatase family enzyme